MVYPHWVNYIRYLLETKYDSQTIYRSGFRVYTTLDPTLQKEADRIVAEQVAALAGKNATDGALVAIRPQTGEILAMVGSADFYNDARLPGRSICPSAPASLDLPSNPSLTPQHSKKAGRQPHSFGMSQVNFRHPAIPMTPANRTNR